MKHEGVRRLVRRSVKTDRNSDTTVRKPALIQGGILSL